MLWLSREMSYRPCWQYEACTPSTHHPWGSDGFEKVKRTGAVYFVGGGELVKIGWSSDVLQRLKAIRCASPVPVVLLRVIQGVRVLERQMHRRFADY